MNRSKNTRVLVSPWSTPVVAFIPNGVSLMPKREGGVVASSASTVTTRGQTKTTHRSSNLDKATYAFESPVILKDS